MREERESMLFVQIYCDLGIALASKLVAFCDELVSNFVVTIKLAIHDGMHIAFSIVERLLSFGSQVDNGKTVVAEC
jgi:hypothetical protein